jgi:predicted LPLAT superfamily acyltransferase
MAWLSLSFGWGAAQLLIGPIALYFFSASPGARANSRAFLRRALGREPRLIEQFRHFLVFSNVVLDRIFLLSGRDSGYRTEVIGLPALTGALAETGGRGCLLLGSHLGSFEALRAFGRTSPVPVRPLMYRANAGTFGRLTEHLNPALARDIIEIGTPDAMLRVQEALDRGEIIAILADRVPDGARRRGVAVDFLGAPATFPTTPLLLAARFGVPAVLCFGVRAAPRTYRIEFAPLALRVTLDKVPDYLRLYVRELEARCRVHPFNWFNFHDFWNTPPTRAAAGHAAASDTSAPGLGAARRGGSTAE